MSTRRAVTMILAISSLPAGCSHTPCRTARPDAYSDDPEPFHDIDDRPPGSKKGPPWTPVPGPLQKEFEAAHPVLAPAQCAGLTDSMGITELSIELDGCKGHCLAFTLRLYADGHAEYDWRKSPDRRETMKGKIDSHAFARVAQFAVEIGYFDLDDYYSCDNDYRGRTTFTSVVRDGRRKSVAHTAFANSGPFRLKALEDAIADEARHIRWIKDK